VSRNLRLAHLPPMQARLRFSGYLTVPASDQQVMDALAPFLVHITLWRDRTKLPTDWPVPDDPEIQDPPAGTGKGITLVWGEGNDISSESVIGDPQSPWRLLVGTGQLVIDAVWLYDSKAEPWPTTLGPCPTTCPPCPNCEAVTPPSAECHSVSAGIFGAVVGGLATAGIIWWRNA